MGTSTARLPEGTDRVWAQLTETAERRTPEAFDPESLDGLPEPAQRWLRRVLPAGTPLLDTVVISMTGAIKLGPRWLDFTAEQVLRAGVGFVWKPVVGGHLLRFTGADFLGPDDARMEFRLHGLIPVAKQSGPHTARSAVGRLAAETIAWLPEAATPQAGARWAPIDDHRATVTVDARGASTDVEVYVDDSGRLGALSLERWNDSMDAPGLRPFGGVVESEFQAGNGVRVAGSGTVGWGYGTPAWPGGAFFRYTLTEGGRRAG